MSRARRERSSLAALAHLRPHELRELASRADELFPPRAASREERMRRCTIADPSCGGEDCSAHPTLARLVEKGFEQPLQRDPQRLALLRRRVLAPAEDLAEILAALRQRPARERAELLRHGASSELLAALLSYPEHPLVLSRCVALGALTEEHVDLLAAQPLTDAQVATLASRLVTSRREHCASTFAELPFARACFALLRVPGGRDLAPSRLEVLARRATRRVEHNLALAYLEGLAEDWTGTPSELVSFLELSELNLE